MRLIYLRSNKSDRIRPGRSFGVNYPIAFSHFNSNALTALQIHPLSKFPTQCLSTHQPLQAKFATSLFYIFLKYQRKSGNYNENLQIKYGVKLRYMQIYCCIVEI